MTKTPYAARPSTINIFLADGTPDGLRVVEKSNWTGIALMCARAQFDEVSKRPEFDRPCLYLLIGPSGEIPDRHRIYIGQSDEGRSRIVDHSRKKEFWTHVILFTSKDANVNRAHVQYLEAQLIRLAHKAKRSDLENGNIPGVPFLSEGNRADMDSFLTDMLLIYPLLGVSAFTVIESAERHNESDSALLTLKGPDTQATGRLTTQGFLVLAGATARLHPVPSYKPYRRKLRERLLADGVLVPVDGKLVLQQDYAFNSPAEAGSILMGRGSVGPEYWKDASGKSLQEIQGSQETVDIDDPDKSQGYT